ncbi:hypothetical protein B7P43_G04194 [Cryptotermes secundus]|uniref:Uncharacterized protein n=1 Tax=Cryptotermes secundus TaxID=105785 RepID=A0A2J7PY10_9NEOP|nr:hypothetical protein B7P43_G04194 [Cryptotermes secundus]
MYNIPTLSGQIKDRICTIYALEYKMTQEDVLWYILCQHIEIVFNWNKINITPIPILICMNWEFNDWFKSIPFRH